MVTNLRKQNTIAYLNNNEINNETNHFLCLLQHFIYKTEVLSMEMGSICHTFSSISTFTVVSTTSFL